MKKGNGKGAGALGARGPRFKSGRPDQLLRFQHFVAVQVWQKCVKNVLKTASPHVRCVKMHFLLVCAGVGVRCGPRTGPPEGQSFPATGRNLPFALPDHQHLVGIETSHSVPAEVWNNCSSLAAKSSRPVAR